jgi:pimeloyl-ACP methyl ester carboxylesterase
MDRLGEIRVPALIIIGEKDDQYLRAADVLEARIPNAERVTIAGAGHIANLDDPAAFDSAVVDFLGRLPARELPPSDHLR